MLHGTNPASDEMIQRGITLGFGKVNQNRAVRHRYMEFLKNNHGVELTALQEKGVQIYSEEIERIMHMQGSAGKAAA